MKEADLHIHTYYSDSTASPLEVIEQAHHCGLGCIAITDHDTIDGIKPTIEAAKKFDIEVIPGIELSTDFHGKDIHVLGYFFDYENEGLIDYLISIQNSRVERMEKMIKKLQTLGISDITLEEVCALVKSKSVGRPHLAAVLMNKGKVSSIRQAFDRYLAEGATAYVPKFKQTPHEAIAFIRKIGGIAVLAHPMATQVDELIAGFVESGLGGLEVYYPNASEQTIQFYYRLAKKYQLAITGGSDAHGEAKKNTCIGKVKIPYSLIENLKESLKSQPPIKN